MDFLNVKLMNYELGFFIKHLISVAKDNFKCYYYWHSKNLKTIHSYFIRMIILNYYTNDVFYIYQNIICYSSYYLF